MSNDSCTVSHVVRITLTRHFCIPCHPSHSKASVYLRKAVWKHLPCRNLAVIQPGIFVSALDYCNPVNEYHRGESVDALDMSVLLIGSCSVAFMGR